MVILKRKTYKESIQTQIHFSQHVAIKVIIFRFLNLKSDLHLISLGIGFHIFDI